MNVWSVSHWHVIQIVMWVSLPLTAEQGHGILSSASVLSCVSSSGIMAEGVSTQHSVLAQRH